LWAIASIPATKFAFSQISSSNSELRIRPFFTRSLWPRKTMRYILKLQSIKTC
jgi:hypothetical protein